MAKNVFNKVSSEAFNNFVLDAGMLLKNFDPATPKAPDDKDIICATTGGIQASCVASYTDFGEDVDNVPNGMKEMKVLDGWECKMSFTALDMTADTLKLALGPATVTGNAVTPKNYLEDTDFTEKVWLVCGLMSGGWAAVCLKNVLSSGGVSIQTTKKGKGQLSVELQGHFSASKQDEVPMEFYVSATAISE